MPSRIAPLTKIPLSLSLLSCFCFATTSALAQVRTEDRVAAESLFTEGRQLLLAGDYERACPKLEASRRLEPALGTWLNLADCYEKLGRFASAWAEFKSAAAAAQKAGDALRKETALGRAAALEPRLSRLRLVVADESITVLQNGAAVSPAVFGSAIPVDPGTHRIEAEAPNKAPWSQSVEVRGEGALVEVTIPALADAPPGPPPSAESSEPPAMTDRSGSSQRTWAWVVGGAGVASLAVGTVFGALAASSWSKAEDSCADPPFECTRPGLEDDARMQATIATVGFIVGAAALGTSVVLFVTADDGPEATGLAIGPGHVSWRGSF
jgi:tetratricopeptide (TPR) repeat protein